jgi:hypothetical protein
MRSQRALQRAQRDLDVLLGEQPAHDDRVALRRPVEERTRCLVLGAVERPGAGPHLRLGGRALAQVAPHAIARDAQLAGDPLASPAQRAQRS